jgi:LacI family transcriptional regulator, galactose operon repressor
MKPTVQRRKDGVVRLADVASLAGVGTSIASRIINGDPTVSIRPETRERVLKAARELNYRPNAFARGLKLARTTTLGMVVPNIAYPVNMEIIRGAEHAANAAGYVMLLVDAEEFDQTGEAYKRLLLEQRVDGLLVASASTTEPLLEELSAHRLPFVLVNRRSTRVAPAVTADDALGTGLAVDHLVELGHTQIAFIGGPGNADTAQRRLSGYRTAMRRAGLRIPHQYVAEATFEEARGYDAMERLLGLERRPTAVVAWSLAAAVGALSAVHRHGLHVPGDVSVIGFHDAPFAAYLEPPLTTVWMPLRELGERSVETLVRLIEGERVRSITVRTKPRLQQRASTGPGPAG